ncbi:RteC protein [Paenimyroides ummariense]|uniref:RteC protein n=1 Tax=Paenimyroides ummariense TaxID=913024 RepID=A0A1I5EZJ7_9FLAO|nr:RteC domain-containing protein [Paenimyroides ummariense]SFO16810.1 RteC protein [Paenimyroides ummariense]
MKHRFFHEALSKVSRKEERLTMKPSKIIEESYSMTLLLKDLLMELKEFVINSGFDNELQEIDFFKNIKPQILGKLIFYNKVYRMEIACPVPDGKLLMQYFSSKLEQLKKTFKEHTVSSDFYRYYRSNRTDMDNRFFRLGNIEFYSGLNSVAFEMDPQFSTYYDYKVSRIISDDLLYHYLLRRMDPDESEAVSEIAAQAYLKDIYWTHSKNALIELVYALHATGAVSNGRVGISKLAMIFEMAFSIKLGDLHHSFHRMKDRSGSKTYFLDQLTTNLEKYMHKDLD